MKINKLRFLLLLMSLAIIVEVWAQDKHDYVTPSGKSVFFRDVVDANRTVLRMNEISPLTTDKDGLMVSFDMRANLSLITRPLKLLSFTLETEEQSFLDVFYDKGTLTFRRKYSSGSSFYYDYNLYDPLFLVEAGEMTWEVHLFFTASFFWIETRHTRLLTDNKWHGPIFFGLNLPIRACMNDYLNRSADAKIIFGDANPSTVFTMPEEIAVYEFKYMELKDELQANFCNEN